MKGPLIDEFRRMLRDMGLGMTRQRTLNQLAKRCDLEEIYLFTSSVIQAEHLGTSMSRTLKMQADNMRDRHRQAVRTAAMQAPIKIIFPMVFFIFPSIFVMVVFPAALSLMKSLGKCGAGNVFYTKNPINGAISKQKKDFRLEILYSRPSTPNLEPVVL